MWKYVRIFLPIVVIGFMAPMMMPGENGKPIMSPSDWLPDKKTISKVTESFNTVTNAASSLSTGEPVFSSTKKQLYKWRDKKGHWQFTDNIKHVPDYALAQLQAESLPKAVNSMAPPPMAERDNESPSLVKPSGSVDISKMPELVDEAKKVRAQMEARNKELEKI